MRHKGFWLWQNGPLVPALRLGWDPHPESLEPRNGLSLIHFNGMWTHRRHNPLLVIDEKGDISGAQFEWLLSLGPRGRKAL